MSIAIARVSESDVPATRPRGLGWHVDTLVTSRHAS
jgi:hypothetical protein